MITIPKPSMIDPAKLKPASYNPRKMPKRQMAALKQSIIDNGFVEPVVAQRKTKMIIGGHQRVLALREVCREHGLAVPQIPVVLLDIDDRQARILNVGLNRITGDFDQELLANLLTELKDDGSLSTDEILGSGFTSKEIDNIIARSAADTPDDLSTFASSITLSLRFNTVEERDAAKALLAERTNQTGKKSGTIVRELLDEQARTLDS